MKAQVSTEYMIIAGFGILLILVSSNFLMKTYNEYSDENKISLAKNTVYKMGETSDLVFSQGPPAKMQIEIYIPKGVQEISFSDKTLLFKIKTSSGINDVYYQTVPQLTGSLPTKFGHYYISLTAEEDHVEVNVV